MVKLQVQTDKFEIEFLDVINEENYIPQQIFIIDEMVFLEEYASKNLYY